MKLRNSVTPVRDYSIITSRPGGRWVYRFFVFLHDGKLGGRGGWYLIKVRDVTFKKTQ